MTHFMACKIGLHNVKWQTIPKRFIWASLSSEESYIALGQFRLTILWESQEMESSVSAVRCCVVLEVRFWALRAGRKCNVAVLAIDVVCHLPRLHVLLTCNRTYLSKCKYLHRPTAKWLHGLYGNCGATLVTGCMLCHGTLLPASPDDIHRAVEHILASFHSLPV